LSFSVSRNGRYATNSKAIAKTGTKSPEKGNKYRGRQLLQG